MSLSNVLSAVLLNDRRHYMRLIGRHRGLGSAIEANRLATLKQIEDELLRRGVGRAHAADNRGCRDCQTIWTVDHDSRPCAACDVERCADCGDANECSCNAGQSMDSAVIDDGCFPRRPSMTADSMS